MVMRKWMIFRFGLSVLVARKRSGVDGWPWNFTQVLQKRQNPQRYDRDDRYRLMSTVLTICTTRSTVLFVRTTGQEVRVCVSS